LFTVYPLWPFFSGTSFAGTVIDFPLDAKAELRIFSQWLNRGPAPASAGPGALVDSKRR